MTDVYEQAFALRVSVVVLTALLFVSRLCGSACGESDSDVSSSGPFPLLLVHFLRENCDDVALRISMHQVDAETLPYRDVRRRTVALKQLPCSCLSC